MPIAAAFERDGEEAFRAREAEVVGSLLEEADGGAIALGGGSVLSERVREALARHVVVWLQVDAAEAWRADRRHRPPARPQRRGRRPPARGAPAALRRARRRGRADGRPRASSPAPCPRSRRSPSCRGGPGCSGRPAPPASTRPSSAAACSAAGWWPLASRRFCVTDAAVAALYADRVEPLAAASRGRAGGGVEDDGRGRAGAARAGPRRDDPRGPRRRPRRRRRRRPRRLLRPPLPARRAGGPGSDHAGRPGRLRLRRQDRRRPARGQELRRRLPPAGGGARRHRDAGDAAARRSWRRASSRR